MKINSTESYDFFLALTYRARILLILKLKVPDQIINKDKEALKQAQATDPNLDSTRTQYDPNMSLTGNAKICCLGLISALF